MKHGSNPRRARSRGNGKRHPSPRGGQSIESNGPEVKVRGTAQQVQEKYLALARDAFSSGDRIAAEGYFQFAEHYHRSSEVAKKTYGRFKVLEAGDIADAIRFALSAPKHAQIHDMLMRPTRQRS